MTEPAQRIDKWLWYARFLKTRTAATKFVADGKVRVNRTRVNKAGSTVSPGDVLTFTLHSRLRIVEVLAPGTRRGPATEARELYEDLSPAPPEKNSGATPQNPVPAAERPAGSGRPTKKQRRDIDAWLDQEN